jgi:hypothetical protein
MPSWPIALPGRITGGCACSPATCPPGTTGEFAPNAWLGMVRSRPMNSATCGKCGASVSADQIEYTLVGAYCKRCHVAETADVAQLERAFVRSTGRRQLIIGLVMLAIGIAILSLGQSGGSSIMLVPTGMLLGGIVECALGLSKLSSKP